MYEYGCRSCQKVHEVIQKFSDAPLAECPDCNGPVEKLVSLSSFALKGSGWYTTDYKKSSSSLTPSASFSNSSSSEGKSDAASSTTSGTTSQTS